jgi:hypothetical protein
MTKPLLFGLVLFLFLLLFIHNISNHDQARRENDYAFVPIADGIDASDLLQEEHRRLELDRRLAIVLQTFEKEQEIGGRLIDGRLTLKEAARHFHRLNQTTGVVTHIEELPGSTAGERTCRQVINHVHECLFEQDDPARALVLARLEAELAKLLKDDSISRILDDMD